MIGKTISAHAIWGALALAAFLAGWQPWVANPSAKQDEESEGRNLRLDRELSQAARWTYGPGDRSSDFSSAMSSALSETNEEIRKERLAGLMTELNPRVLDELTEEMVPGLLKLLQEAESIDSPWHKQEAFFTAWARLNPEAAFAYVADAENRAGANSWGRPAVIEEWIKIDPGAAQKAVMNLTEKADRRDMAADLMRALLRTDLDAAIAFSAKYESATRDGGFPSVGSIAKKLVEERGVEAVQSWLDSIDVGEVTPNYKQRAIEHLAYWKTGPEMSALLSAENNQGLITPKLLSKIATSATARGENRLEKRLDWLAALPAEVGAQQAALGDQFETYLKEDFESAGKWLADQKLEPKHDQAIVIFLRNATMDDVSAAMRWAEKISDSELRREYIQYVKKRGG